MYLFFFFLEFTTPYKEEESWDIGLVGKLLPSMDRATSQKNTKTMLVNTGQKQERGCLQVSSPWSPTAVNLVSVLCWDMTAPSAVTKAILTYQMQDQRS